MGGEGGGAEIEGYTCEIVRHFTLRYTKLSQTRLSFHPQEFSAHCVFVFEKYVSVFGKVSARSLAFQGGHVGGLELQNSCVLTDCFLQLTEHLFDAGNSVQWSSMGGRGLK